MADTKICGKCGEDKPLKLFSKNKNSKDGLQSWCKGCIKDYANINKSEISGYQKTYREEHKEEARTYNTHYRETNKEILSAKQAIYRLENKDKIALDKLKYEKMKSNSDPVFKLRKRVSLLVRVALAGNKSNFSILDYLPYSISRLKEHLEKQFEPWMSWDNWGIYDPSTWDDNDSSTWTWQLDHIIPQAKLPYSSMMDDNFEKCWALSNLRPLSAKVNVQIGSKTRRNK
jgi:hypothetical protein